MLHADQTRTGKNNTLEYPKWLVLSALILLGIVVLASFRIPAQFHNLLVWNKAKAAIDAKQPVVAIPLLRELHEHYPHSEEISGRLVIAYLKAGQFAEGQALASELEGVELSKDMASQIFKLLRNKPITEKAS